MKKQVKKLVALSLALMLLFGTIPEVFAAETTKDYSRAEIESSIEKGVDWWKNYHGASTNLVNKSFVGKAGNSDYDVLIRALANYGYKADYSAYLDGLKEYIIDVFNFRFVNESVRNCDDVAKIKWQLAQTGQGIEELIMTVEACGGNPSNIGKDNSGNTIDLYAFEKSASSSMLLGCQQPDGSYEPQGYVAGPSTTAYIVADLASHYSSNSSVKASVNKALNYLSEKQTSSGAMSAQEFDPKGFFATINTVNALVRLGINPQTDSRFIKNGHTLIEALMGMQSSSGAVNGNTNDSAWYVYVMSNVLKYMNGEKLSPQLPSNIEGVSSNEKEEMVQDQIKNDKASIQKAQLSFNDVSKNNWYYSAVSYAVENNLMSGVSKDKFSPNVPTNRAMLVTILYRMEGQPSVTTGNIFTDVPQGQWYTNAVMWANEKKIVNGMGNSKFKPQGLITRQQLATMLMRYAEYKGYDISKRNQVSNYKDMAAIDTWALEALQWANAEDLINGRSSTLLVPEGTATRAEAAAILMRFLGNSKA